MPKIADQIFINGYIYTVDSHRTVVEAIAIRDSRIVFTGSNMEAKAWIGDDTAVVDLDGRMMMPSFFEAHCHAQAMAQLMFSANVTGLGTLENYQNAIKEFINENPDNLFVLGNGWTNSIFPPTGPRKEDLDHVSKAIPIAIWSEDHHSIWVNSKAMELAMITMETPNPSDGIIERDMDGNPSGTLREGAADLIMGVIPDFTVEQYKIALKEYEKMSNSLGFTGCLDAVLDVGSHAIEAYKALAAEGELTMRFRGAYTLKPGDGVDQIERLSNSRGGDDVNDLFQINTVKIFADGVIEGGTAFFSEPYVKGAERPEGYKGLPIWETAALNDIVDAAEKKDFQVHVHAIGDAATNETLNAFEYAIQQNGGKNLRHAITHLQIVDQNDIVRFKDLNVIGVPNPYWMQIDDYYFNLHIPYLGLKRADQQYPMKSFMEAGVLLASASDFPVTERPNPFVGIEIGVTRKIPDSLKEIILQDSSDQKYNKSLWAAERVTIADMIASFTYNGAYANFLDKETGSIEVGKSADVIILDKNLFEIPENEVCEVKVLLTLFKGRAVYKESNFDKLKNVVNMKEEIL